MSVPGNPGLFSKATVSSRARQRASVDYTFGQVGGVIKLKLMVEKMDQKGQVMSENRQRTARRENKSGEKPQDLKTEILLVILWFHI